MTNTSQSWFSSWKRNYQNIFTLHHCFHIVFYKDLSQVPTRKYPPCHCLPSWERFLADILTQQHLTPWHPLQQDQGVQAFLLLGTWRARGEYLGFPAVSALRQGASEELPLDKEQNQEKTPNLTAMIIHPWRVYAFLTVIALGFLQSQGLCFK